MGLLSWLFGGSDEPRPRRRRGFSPRYAGGVLLIDTPQSVRVYEVDADNRYEMLWLHEGPHVTIIDARWSGNRIIITFDDPMWGRPRVRVYHGINMFEELRT